MRLLPLISCLFLTALSADEEHTCAHVTQLDSKNVDDEKSKHAVTLLLFYAPWCGHCKRLMPDYDNLCKKIKDTFGTEVLCARVDCTTSEDVCDGERLQGYPTIKAYVGGSKCEFLGPRAADNIYRWLRSLFYSSKDVQDVDTAMKALVESEHSLVAFLKQDSELRTVASEMTCKVNENTFLTVTDPAVATALGLTTPDTFAIFKKEVLHQVLDSAKTVADVLRMFHFVANPLVPDYSPETVSQIFTSHVAHYLVYVYDSAESLESLRGKLEEYAKSRIPSLRVFTINASDEVNKDVVTFFYLSKIPAFVFYDDEKQKFYHMSEQEYTIENFEVFVKGCIDGTIQPFVKKQPIPEGWDSGAVKVLVVDNFQEPFKKHRGGIVLFYAPWCGHCEAFLPTWEEFGKHVAEHHPEIFVGKMDHTQNELSQVEVAGYPTVIAFDGIDKQIPYNGGRTLDDLKTFITSTFYPSEEEEKEEKELEDQTGEHEDL
ncbi:Protein disulfide-isomerase 2 [Thelohanellus kitauei]|uniref:protein disulfide-isomerase n=1 Tax=Thelohanellus kitauei TaxID=669202 RepID=A0A0C2MRH0_THEKT|nr:Protein disulfide-isomerase 2 [Thelohanellus kitauei]